MERTNNKPVAKYQAGGVSAALWSDTIRLRDGSEIEKVMVSVDRRYKDAEGLWKSSGRFGMNDIPKAIVVLFKAYAHMVTGGGAPLPKAGAPVPFTEEEAVE